VPRRDVCAPHGDRYVSERGRTVGVPLGLLAESSYDRAVLKPQVGDLVVLYTDGSLKPPTRLETSWVVTG
jgi:serine phosphatase RsbU (regulator of sigma subunit)